MNNNNYNYYIDLHCHYEDVSKDYLKRVFSENSLISLTASTDFNSYLKLEDIRNENIPNLFFAYGLYPEQVSIKSIDECFEDLNKMNYSNALAIGEIGLDYKLAKTTEQKSLQKQLFEKQLFLAERLNKPVIVHSRYATKDVLDILSSWKLKVVLHWFSGSLEELSHALDRNYFLTIRYNRPNIPDIKNHLFQLFIETDYPVPYNGLTPDVLDIKESYNVFCKQNNINLQELQNQVFTNFCNLFPKVKNRLRL